MQRDVRQRLRLPLWVVICLLTFATAACGGSETGKETTTTAASPTASPPPARGTINIDHFRFPGSVTVGAEITVVNNDPDRHSVTSDSIGEFDVQVQPSSTASFTAPYEPGSYPFHCLYHSSMNGELVVR
jgi:plastocyanin